MITPQMTAFAVPDMPLVQPGDDLVALIMDALAAHDESLQDGDILVISSKIVSKSEDCFVDLYTVKPGAKALELAEKVNKDPRIVEMVLQESKSISRAVPGVLVVEHRLGFVSANAGIDQSNVDDSGHHILLLPIDPDASAAALRQGLQERLGVTVGIVISDTHGRPFRRGNVGVAIGIAGLPAVVDLRGEVDLFGREMLASVEGFGDLLASTAHLLCGETNEGRPVIVLRGVPVADVEHGLGADMNRDPAHDLYR